LRGPLDPAGLRRVFRADTLWGVAAALWLSTGLLRAFGGLEKGSAYYLNNPVFWGKMSLFLLVLGLEIAPMVALIRWRSETRQGRPIDTSRAALFARISTVETVIVALMVFAAAALARGLGQ
jgi:putative membrane protein